MLVNCYDVQIAKIPEYMGGIWNLHVVKFPVHLPGPQWSLVNFQL